MPQYLCKLCEAIFVTGRRLDDEGDNAALQMCQLHPNFYSIQQGAERNCYICDTLLATIEYKTLDSGHDFGRDLQETEYWISYGESKSSFLLSIMATFDVNGEAKMDLQQFRIQPSTLDYFLPTGYPLSPSTSDPACFSIAKSWMRECVETHEQCEHRSTLQPWMPTRLLEINMQGEGVVVRLHITSKEDTGPYITLSHRWGHASILKLTTATLDALQKDMPINSLPRTFQDAIMAVREFNIRYIWIDSLCIIQDSDEDWKFEAAQMDVVYRNAIYNIAATKGTDSESGLFTERKPFSLHPIHVDLEWSGSKERYVVIDNSFWAMEVFEAPLNKRCWVLQERVLSPRVLHYGSRQLFWECRQLRACESYPSGLPSELREPYSRLDDVMSQTDDSARPHSVPLEKQSNQWCMVIQMYSSAALTRESDKLVAISGLARAFQQAYGGEYIAGLWRHQLPAQLVWACEIKHASLRPRKRTAKYVAPSWSWASVNAEVRGHWPLSREEDLVASFSHVEVERLDSNPVGPVASASITIRGRLFRMNWTRIHEEAITADLTIVHDNPNISHAMDAWPDTWDDMPQCEVYLLPIFLAPDETENDSLRGIIVSRIAPPPHLDQTGDYFRRVGCVVASPCEARELWAQFQLLSERDITIL